MWYILIGILGFGFMACAEYFSQRSVGLLKPLLWLASITCLLYALIMTWVDAPRFTIPHVLVVAAWLGLSCFGGLFIYSVFLEVPFQASYVGHSREPKLVTKGTYALTRHPGVIWSTGWLLSTVLISKSLVLAAAVPFWIAANVGCVYLGEKFNLEKAFGEEYKEYQRATPMLIPTKTSILRFIRAPFSRIISHDD
jgi:protein-S-isoprenylcysteine O-methyltransferase Ste14